jgi:DNA repair protein RecO (recombination protein O)
MPTFKARGVVIKTSDWSETSRIASIFTREHGRIRVLAKGGRRVNSTFEISLDLLNVIDVVFIHKSHGGLDLLTEARIAERFPQLRKNINALYAGYYLAELLSEGLQDMDPHPDLFDSALSTLRQFETQDDWLSLISQFELVWLTELGYTPRVDACLVRRHGRSGTAERSVCDRPGCGRCLVQSMPGRRSRCPVAIG